MTTPKERPILFSAPMVRAILDGSKTQTRRVVKWQGVEPGLNLQFSGLSVEKSGSRFVLSSPTRTSHEYRCIPTPCPYGQPGDRLWVREAWQHAGGNTGYWYRATDSEADEGGSPVSCWRPSIHMPRWASRITLEITAVRVERLKDISTEDVIAEGMKTKLREHDAAIDLRVQYELLWEKLNGPQSWQANPWVWVIEFKRVAQQG